jgi:hypothetical protein
MLRAAPGKPARGVLRRGTASNHWVSANYSGRALKICPNHSRVGGYFHPFGRKAFYRCSFTLQLSGFGVERGRLGEVVSLVGDCRPPPPGNPRRPACMTASHQVLAHKRIWKARRIPGGSCFSVERSRNGDNYLSNWFSSTLYCYQNPSNLKELDQLQYFKKNRSYSSCTGVKPVLEFDRLHSHLCGIRGVEPLPIAITNVLETG